MTPTLQEQVKVREPVEDTERLTKYLEEEKRVIDLHNFHEMWSSSWDDVIWFVWPED